MSLQTVSGHSTVSSLTNEVASSWNPVCNITYSRDSWVKLLYPPSDYAFDEAKLLCQESPETWIAWVPNHGEVVLDRSAFYC